MPSMFLGSLASAIDNSPRLRILRERDASFWEAHAKWREAEAAMDAWAEHSDECATAAVLLDKASRLRENMFMAPAHTASALVLKFEALREGPGETDERLPNGLSVGDSMERDAQRIATGELF